MCLLPTLTTMQLVQQQEVWNVFEVWTVPELQLDSPPVQEDGGRLVVDP